MDNNTPNPLDRIRNAINVANSQLEQAKVSGDNESVNKISSDIDALNTDFSVVQAKLQDGKNKDKQDSLDFLASQRRLGYEQKREEYLKDKPGGLYSLTPQQQEEYRALHSDQAITNDEIHAHLARALDVPKDKVDVDTGLDGKNRTVLSLLQTPEEKLQYLQQRFPEGVEQINITGTPAYALKKKDGGYLLADELGTSVKDFTADIVGQAIPVAAGVAAGVAASKMGIKNPSLIVNAIQSGTGFVQDVATRAALGLDPSLGTSAISRGGEALTGLAIDGAAKMLITPLAKRIGEPIKNELAKRVEEAKGLLKEKGFETTAPISYLFGARPLQKEQQLIGRMEGASIGTSPTRNVQKTVDTLGQFKESISGVPQDIYSSTMDVLKKESDDLANVIAQSDKQAGDIVKGVLNRRLAESAVETADKQTIGTTIRDFLGSAKQQLKDTKDNIYNQFYVDAEGITMAPGEVAKHLEAGARSTSKEFKNTGIDKLVNTYKARQGDADLAVKLRSQIDSGKLEATPEIIDKIAKLSESGAVLSASEVDDVVKMAKESVPEGGTFATGGTSTQVAADAAARLRNVQRAKYAENGLSNQWDMATQAYDQALNSKRGLNANILKTKLDSPTMTPTAVVDSITSDPQHIKDILELASNQGPEAVQAINNQLKRAYLTKIGLVSDSATKPSSVTFDEGIVNTLWGIDQAGKTNPLLGNRMVEKLKDLQKAFEVNKLNMSNIDINNIDTLFSTLSDAEFTKVKGDIIKGATARAEQEAFTNNELIKLAKSKNFNLAEGDNLAKALYTASVSDAKDIMRRMPADQKVSLQSDFVNQLMRDLPSSTTTTGGQKIFDGAKFIKSLEGKEGPIIEARIKAIMGKDFFDTFKAAATMAEVNHIPVRNLLDPAIKASLSEDRLKLFGVGNILGWGKDRFMSAAHGADTLVPFWKLMAKDVGPEQTAKNFKNMLNATMAGRIGVTALAHAGRNDPDFKQNINDFLYGRAKEDAGYASKMINNIPSESR